MSHVHNWTHEEDEYISLAHKNGVPVVRMATRLGVHRETVKRRLTHLRKVYDELSIQESLNQRRDRAIQNEWERLENREPPPFQIWARSMIELSRRERRQEQSDG